MRWSVVAKEKWDGEKESGVWSKREMKSDREWERGVCERERVEVKNLIFIWNYNENKR